MPSSALPPVITGLSSIASRYDAFLLDQWGCIHNGVQPYPGVADALRHLRAADKRIIVFSNAPRRSDAVAAGMARIGIGPELYDAMLSAGEAAWQALAKRDDQWHAKLGTRCLHIGPERDRGMLEGNGLVDARSPEEADFVLATGPYDDLKPVEVHDELLRRCRARNLPMLCANPDLEVVRGTQRLVCAGAIAERYAAMGGDVRQYGKPYPDIYARAMRMLDGIDRARVLAIGDSLRTDVAGAHAAGIPVAFIPGGIHGEALGLHMGDVPDEATLEQLLAGETARPDWVLAELRW